MTHAHADFWWQARWVNVVESVLGHAAAVVVGFAMMVIGLGLSVTMVMLPVGLVVGLVGVTIFVGGFFAHPRRD